MFVTSIEHVDIEKVQRVSVSTDDGKIYTFDRGARQFSMDILLVDKVDNPETTSRNQVNIFRSLYERYFRLSKVTSNRYRVELFWIGGTWEVSFDSVGFGETSQNGLLVSATVQGTIYTEEDGPGSYQPRVNFNDVDINPSLPSQALLDERDALLARKADLLARQSEIREKLEEIEEIARRPGFYDANKYRDLRGIFLRLRTQLNAVEKQLSPIQQTIDSIPKTKDFGLPEGLLSREHAGRLLAELGENVVDRGLPVRVAVSDPKELQQPKETNTPLVRTGG